MLESVSYAYYNGRMSDKVTVQLRILKTDAISPEEEAFVRSHWPERYEKAMRYRNGEARRQCIGAAVLFERAGWKEADMRLGSYGKPFLEDGPEFSLSHSGSYVVLVVSGDQPVGADLEVVRARDIDVFSRIFQPEENAWIGNDVKRFFTGYTLKESVMKALGRGFSVSPASFSVLPAVSGSPVEAEKQRFFVKTLFFEETVVSIASGAEIGEILICTA